MKNQLHSFCAKRWPFSNRKAIPLIVILAIFITASTVVRSQVLGLWNFNGNKNGVAGVLNALFPADFSPGIPSRAFNPTVYYGENGWPSGGLSTAHYFEFGLAPLLGHSLNISTISLTIRRSSTGSPAGSGPTRFTVRSSIDGYASDILTDNLTAAAKTFTITPGSSFLSLITGTRFRIYGYQAVTTSGGLSRLVMENLQVNGIGTILPARILNFGAFFKGKTIEVKYGITNNEEGTHFLIERSLNGTDYKAIDESTGVAGTEDFNYSFDDAAAPVAGQIVYYRLKIRFRSGQSIYSSVSAVDLTGVLATKVSLIQQGSTLVVRPTITGAKELNIYSSTGQLLRRVMATSGNNVITADLPQHPPGVYFIKVTSERNTESATVFLN